MQNTFYNPEETIQDTIVPTEQSTDGTMLRGIVHDESARQMGGISGHAGLFSTKTDLEHFMNIWINGGVYKNKKILNETLIKSAVTNQTP